MWKRYMFELSPKLMKLNRSLPDEVSDGSEPSVNLNAELYVIVADPPLVTSIMPWTTCVLGMVPENVSVIAPPTVNLNAECVSNVSVAVPDADIVPRSDIVGAVSLPLTSASPDTNCVLYGQATICPPFML